jgi:predicted CoA-binding protein
MGRFISQGGRMKLRVKDSVREILEKCHTIAVVGLSARPDRPGHYVPAYIQAHGYHIIPVNPNLEKVLGERAYPSLGDIPQAVDLVLLFQRSENVPPFVEQAIRIGAKAVWMQTGIKNETAAAQAAAAGLSVVMDACIMVEHRRWQAE